MEKVNKSEKPTCLLPPELLHLSELVWAQAEMGKPFRVWQGAEVSL